MVARLMFIKNMALILMSLSAEPPGDRANRYDGHRCDAGDHRCDGLAMAGYSLQPCSVDLTDSGILLFLEISCLCDVVEKNKEQQQRDPRKEKPHIYWHVCVSLPSYSYSGSRGSSYSAFRLLKPNWVVSLVVAGKG